MTTQQIESGRAPGQRQGPLSHIRVADFCWMGVGSVALLFATVRRWSGPAAGLIAGAALALTPAVTHAADKPKPQQAPSAAASACACWNGDAAPMSMPCIQKDSKMTLRATDATPAVQASA